MGTVRYTTIKGEVIAEKRNGVRRQYVPDPLGSTVALLDNTQTQVNTFTYWPYGEVRTSTGTTPPSFQFVGTKGYYSDAVGRTYVRARYLHTQKGRWLTEDPVFRAKYAPNLYVYAENKPVDLVDPLGLIPKADPACKTAGAINAGIVAACAVMRTSPYMPKLSGNLQRCMRNWCALNTVVHCGGSGCSSNCSYTNCNWLGYCSPDITICGARINDQICKQSGGITGLVLHEVTHVCGILDHNRIPNKGKHGKLNPADQIACDILGIKPWLPAY